MKVTEKEAKKLICQEGRSYPVGVSYCLGSQCMAWVWEAKPWRTHYVADDAMAVIEPPRPDRVPAHWAFKRAQPEDDMPACWVEPEEEAKARRIGYCGKVHKS